MLDQEYIAKANRLSKNLLRWHLRQAALVKMRGAGELIPEHDFTSPRHVAGLYAIVISQLIGLKHKTRPHSIASCCLDQALS